MTASFFIVFDFERKLINKAAYQRQCMPGKTSDHDPDNFAATDEEMSAEIRMGGQRLDG
jgi:hypothetical protein